MPFKSNPRRASSSQAIPASKGRLGLHKLWQDRDSPRQFNLVLVHGFAGDAFDTWTHANGKCWPKDFPPNDDENLKAACVYVWGYRAVDSGEREGLTAVPQSIYSIGESLCNDLHDNEIYRRPITFVGHGIGGIVVKSALDVSRNRPSLYGKIFDETKHVIFLDTPHHGVPRDVLQSIYGRRTKRNVWAKYELWSEVLGDLSKKFSEMEANFAVSSSSASLLNNKGDPEAQVTPGQTGFIHAKRERSFHMDCVDHSSICKFASLDDINYKRLAARIRIGQLAVEKRNPLLLSLRSWISGQDGDENSDKNQREHEDNSSRRHKETCKWLFQDESFRRWIAKDNAISALLVTGPSGVGKTMLTSAAVEYVSNLPECPTVGYIFLRFDIRLLHRDLLRMIASSLLDRAVDCNVVPDKAFNYPSYNKAESAKLKEFIQILLEALAYVGHIYFFIDGLNEVPSSLESTKPENEKRAEKELGDIQNVIDFLFKCASSQQSLRLWFSSQADDMTLAWMKKRNYAEINIPEEDSTRDVQLYLKWAIEEKLKNRISSGLLRLFAEITVLVKAENNFRWAATMIEEISKCSNEDDVIETLKVGLPWRVSDVYGQTLRRLRSNDIEDQRLPGGRIRSVGLSKAILSILTFAKRPLSLRALQEAISAYSLQERNTGCLNISPGSINNERSLVNRCVPFVKYVPSKNGNGVFRLDHESVSKFLLGHASDSQTVASDRMVDPEILAKACLNYLFQQRYNKLLQKYTAFEFRTDWGSDIRDHHLVQYAAKYWYRHLEETTKSEELSQRAVAFVKSPQFITAIQIQSLFVPGHFIQDLDCDDRKKRCIKKNLPGWLEEHHEGGGVFKDYHSFLAEWGAFLQRGIADKVNGELDRCLWSALGPTNYFNRYSSSLQRYPAYLLQLEETGLDDLEGFYIAAASYEQMRMTVWKVTNSSRHLEFKEVSLAENTWVLDADGPQLENSRRFTFSKMDTNWEMYDPGPSRKLPILPSFTTPERLPPVAFTGAGSDRLRIGSTEFFAKQDGTLTKEDGAVVRRESQYWENIQVREPYRATSRRRVVAARFRFRKAPAHHRYDWHASSSEGFDSTDTSSTEEEETSEEEEISEEEEVSEQSFGITSPAESWSSASNSSLQDSDSHSDATSQLASSRAAETSCESSEQETQLDRPDVDTDSTRSSGIESTDTSDDSLHSDSGATRVISNSEEDSDESIGPCDSSSSQQQQRIEPSKSRGKGSLVVQCDVCLAKALTVQYRCSLCSKDNFFDLCRSCVEKGHWCADKFHMLQKRRVRKRQKVRILGNKWQNECQRSQCLVVEELGVDPVAPAIFRFQSHGDDSMEPLYDSPPQIHQSKPLLVWPLGGWNMMFADLKSNRYFIRPSHSQHRDRRTQEISVNVHFSDCGGFLYTATIYANSRWGTKMHIVLSTHRLSDQIIACPPKEVARMVVELGVWARHRNALHPFTIVWGQDCAYVAASAEKLCVYQLPLKRTRQRRTQSGGSGEATTSAAASDLRQPAIPVNEIVLPHSARNRCVQFFPGIGPASDGIVVIGPRDGGKSAAPIVVYLPAGSLGGWKPIPDKGGDIDISDEGKRGGEALFETFDAEYDCDLIPYDPNFNL